MKFYKILGTLPDEVITTFITMLMKKFDSKTDSRFQRLEFDDSIHQYFMSIFENTDLKVQKNTTSTAWIQKAFYSGQPMIYPIHRDGVKCMSALNIALQTNSNDWIRWYDSELINNITTLPAIESITPRGFKTRNSNISDRESVPFLEEFRPTIGTVYALNVDQFHTWKCSGPGPRMILQTKFEGFPDLETIYTSLKDRSFNCIQK